MFEVIGGVPIVHWNPRRNNGPFPLNRLPVGRRVRNFGDLLGPLIVSRLVGDGNRANAGVSPRRLLAVGSIMSFAADDDVVWGTGVNGKARSDSYAFRKLDVRAVRGPLSADFLERRQIPVPEVFGDPGLLLPLLFPAWKNEAQNKTRRLGVVPNLHDYSRFSSHPGVISPIGDPVEVIADILRSEVVVASSLHGIVVAEAFGIPVLPLVSGVEPVFKYRDYFEGTGRASVKMYDDFGEAESIALSGESDQVTIAMSGWDSQPLLGAFPGDLWMRPPTV